MRVQKVRFCLLTEVRILAITGKVGEMGPLQYKSAHAGQSIGCIANGGLVCNVQTVVRDAGGRIECKFQNVREFLRLGKKSVNVRCLSKVFNLIFTVIYCQLTFEARLESGPFNRSYPDSIPAK